MLQCPTLRNSVVDEVERVIGTTSAELSAPTVAVDVHVFCPKRASLGHIVSLVVTFTRTLVAMCCAWVGDVLFWGNTATC